jgi:hypothetical protein
MINTTNMKSVAPSLSGSPVTREIQRLREQNERLSNLVELLETRIASVLSQPYPMDTSPAECYPAVSQLPDTMRELNDTFDTLLRRMDNIINRVEL